MTTEPDPSQETSEFDPIAILEKTKKDLTALRDNWFKPVDTSQEAMLALLTPEQREALKKLESYTNQNGK